MQPDLEYAIVAFVTLLSSKNRYLLSSLFRCAVRAVFGTSPQAETAPLMQQLNTHPIEDRWLLHLLVFMYRCTHGLAAECLVNMFQLQKSRLNQCTTRGQVNGLLQVVRHNSKSGVNLLSHRLVLLWNGLPNDMQSCQSVIVFKSMLWSRLISDANFCRQCKELLFMSVSNV